MNLDDVGTRYQHYRELLDLWEDGYELLQRSKELTGGLTAYNTILMKSLEHAIELMTKQLEIQSDMYVNMHKIGREVDKIEDKRRMNE